MASVKPSAAVIVIPTSEIQGNPRPLGLGQWVPHEPRCWWAEDALGAKHGLSPDRTTGRFLERSNEGWRFKVLTDAERASLFFASDAKPGS